MGIRVRELSPDAFGEYPEVSSAFLVESVLECEVVGGGLGGIALREKTIVSPYPKNDRDESPPDWAKRYDLSTWGIFLATDGPRAVGGAAVAPPSPGIVVTEGRSDVAALWDVRVSPTQRRRGVGTALLRRCADWARSWGFKILAIETQNVNVPACRFYAKNGCELAEIRRSGYAGRPEVAHEAMLIWHLKL